MNFSAGTQRRDLTVFEVEKLLPHEGSMSALAFGSPVRTGFTIIRVSESLIKVSYFNSASIVFEANQSTALVVREMTI
jgi:hypothetical protein